MAVLNDKGSDCKYMDIVWGIKMIFVFMSMPGVGATEITYIGEWDFTQYRRNAPFFMTI